MFIDEFGSMDGLADVSTIWDDSLFTMQCQNDIGEEIIETYLMCKAEEVERVIAPCAIESAHP